MFRSYLKVAVRTLLANPLFSTINIVGLAIGLACCICIAVFVNYEMSHDKQWHNADRIYRVTRDYSGNELHLARVAPPIAPLLVQDFQGVKRATRLFLPGNVTVGYEHKTVSEDQLVVADPNLFEFFDLEFTAGSRESALAAPTNIVISERAAERYFGSDNPMGKSLNLYGGNEVTVSGVFRDLPRNTHMQFELVVSTEILPQIMGPQALELWGSNNYFTYLELAEGFDAAELSDQLDDFLVKHIGRDHAENTSLHLQALPDIYLTSNLDGEWRENGSWTVVYTFGAIAAVILIIACINFMNLTTARSTQRAREVGIRKAIGANRGQLIIQFLGESILMTAIAMLIALALVEITLPVFAAFLEKPLVFSLGKPMVLMAVVVGAVLVGVLAGSYPALYLSRFQPAVVLKGVSGSRGEGLLRKLLVVAQFSISITLLIATGVVVAQVHYAKTTDLGFDRERNIIMRLPSRVGLWETYDPLRTELEAHPGIESVVYSSRVPSMQNLDGSGYFLEGVQPSMETVQVLSDIKVDAHWFDHYNVEFLAGRAFQPNEVRPDAPTEEKPSVKAWAVLNESAARQLGWSPEEAIGKVIRQPTNRTMKQFYNREIVGVIPDLYFSSLHNARKATVFAEPSPIYNRTVSVKLAPGRPEEAIRHIETTWHRLLPDAVINWQFLDEAFDARYRTEVRQAKLFGGFSGLAIFVATLGLFGLASFTTERRTKEIGIRKVMGASAIHIVMLLTRDFTRLILLANVIAWPVAYYAMTQWLTRFAYAAPFSEWAWMFIASSVAALLVAWLTIAGHAGRAATARPVQALRYE